MSLGIATPTVRERRVRERRVQGANIGFTTRKEDARNKAGSLRSSERNAFFALESELDHFKA